MSTPQYTFSNDYAQRQLKLAQAIRRLHGLGQDADAIAAALSVDVEEVRRVLSA